MLEAGALSAAAVARSAVPCFDSSDPQALRVAVRTAATTAATAVALVCMIPKDSDGARVIVRPPCHL
ncbi:hypothetical protein D3C59_31320 [Streptomyces sp. SHP22-7]|nr:hypothetical protein D3C59_31320 [Streptomyces sp. SHP22-7]